MEHGNTSYLTVIEIFDNQCYDRYNRYERSKKLNSQQVKIFLSVAACKNFSLAAEQLYLSQSVISYHVRALEKEIGFSLFDRNTHGVELTPAGTAFYKSMAIIETQYKEALDKARKIATGGQSKLNICFGTPTSPTMIGQIVNRIYSILSLEEIGLSKRGYDDVLQPLLSGSADILFTYPPFFREELGLRKKDFCMTWTSCMMCPQHPLANRTELTFSALKGQTLIWVDSKNAHIEHRDIYHRIHQNIENSPKLDSTPRTFDQAQGFAIAGRGIMLVRTIDRAYHPNIDGLVSIPLTDVKPMPLIAVWREDDFCALGRKLIDNIPNITE